MTYKSATLLPGVRWCLYFIKFIVVVFLSVMFCVPLTLIKQSYLWVWLCVWAQSAHMCVCQVCVNRDERVRAWPCIIHAADLVEGFPGEPRVIVVAADINNAAMKGACFNWGGAEDGEGPDRERDREGLSGENKPFAALIESLAAVPSCQGRRSFTTWPLKESLF